MAVSSVHTTGNLKHQRSVGNIYGTGKGARRWRFSCRRLGGASLGNTVVPEPEPCMQLCSAAFADLAEAKGPFAYVQIKVINEL